MKENDQELLIDSKENEENEKNDGEVKIELNNKNKEDEQKEVKSSEDDDSDKEENVPLIITEEDKKEKQNLVDIFNLLNKKLTEKENENKRIDFVYGEYFHNDDVTKRKIKKNINYTFLYIMFYFISPLFVMINLIGIFQIISVMNRVFDTFIHSLLVYVNIKDDKIESFGDFYCSNYNFYDKFYDDSLNKPLDFNLMMVMDFLGCIILKSRGFRISSVIFLILNVGALFLILNFDFDIKDKEFQYTLFNVLYLLLCYAILFVGVGASALLSQQMLVDSFLKLRKYLDKQRKKKEKKEKKAKKKEEEKRKKEKEQKGEEQNNELKKEVSDDFTIKPDEQLISNTNNAIDDKEIEEVKIKKKKTKEEKKKEKKEKKKEKKRRDLINNAFKSQEKNKFDYFFMICITTIMGYYGKYLLNLVVINHRGEVPTNFICNGTSLNLTNEEDILLQNTYKQDKDLFTYIMIIYGSAIFISIILYSIFVLVFRRKKKKKDKKTKKEDSFNICQICGYTIYSQNIIDKNRIIPKCETLKLIGKSFKNCFNETICDILNKKIEKRKKKKENNDNDNKNEEIQNNNNENNNIIDINNQNNKKCSCICCCCDYNDVNFEQNQVFFCYCYQGRRKLNWFNKYITSDTQKKIIPKMLSFFQLQFTMIGFDRLFNENNDEKNPKKEEIANDPQILSVVFLISFILFFLITISFGKMERAIRPEKSDKKIENVSKMSTSILEGMEGVIYYISFYVFILSFIYLLGNDELYNNVFLNNYYIYPPILMNKFFFFTLTYYCLSYSEDQQGFELISSSTLISIYLVIWDLFYSNIRDYLPISVLFIIQLIPSGYYSISFSIKILVIIISTGNVLISICLFCFIIYLFCCFGGLFNCFSCDKEDQDFVGCCINKNDI